MFGWVAAMFKGHSKGSGLYVCDFTKKNLSRTPTGIAGHDFHCLGTRQQGPLNGWFSLVFKMQKDLR